MYGKAFASMYDGSMFGSPATVFAVWGYVLAKQRASKAHGVYTVELNPALLAATFATTEDSIIAAIQKLCDEDPRSRSPDENGRRLVPSGDEVERGPGLYRVVNGAKYAAMRDEDERRLYLREAKRRSRIKSTKSTYVNNVNRGQPPSTQLDSDLDVDSDRDVDLDVRTERESDARAREEDLQAQQNLGHHVRLSFDRGYRTAHAGAAMPQTSAHAKALSAITVWVSQTAVSRDTDPVELADRLIAAFFASPKAAGSGFRVTWLAQDPLEYLEPQNGAQAPPRGGPAPVSTTFDESKNPEWAK